MIKEAYQIIRSYLILQVIDVASKQEIKTEIYPLEKSSHQLVKKHLNTKSSLEKSDYNLIKKERR